jgi:sugar phosphate isomerase/epimerase
MKIGMLTNNPIAELELIKSIGFKSIEILAWPGDYCDPESGNAPENRIKEMKKILDDQGIEISCIGYYPNYLDPENEEYEFASLHLKNLFKVAKDLNVNTVCTFAGRDPKKSIADNIPEFKKVFDPLAEKALDMGIKIAFENCPMMYNALMQGGNIAMNPKAWEMMFDAVNYENIGLEYDPSHLIRSQINCIRVIYEFGPRIFHVHAKDAEWLPELLYWRGIYDCPFGGGSAKDRVGGTVSRDRFPGMGQVPWGQVISAFYDVGYKGNLDIEGRHDPLFATPEREAIGLRLAKEYLEKFIG